MKRFFNFDLLQIVIGCTVLIIIFVGSGIVNTKNNNKQKNLLLQRQRFLSDPRRDFLLMEDHALRHVTDAFNRAMYSRKRSPKRVETSRFLVEDHISRWPEHIFVETDAKQQGRLRSIRRSLKDVYSY